LLYHLWRSELGADAVRHAIFHAVSAFCNAGFSTFSDNLVGQRHNPAVLAVLMALIVTGGLGFLTLEDVALRYGTVAGRQRRRLSLHSRLVLTTTALLLVGGWALFAVLEWDGILAGLPGIGDRLVNALFMSVTCRTAGFNTVDYGQARESTLFATNLLMSVGGSPGSTAGGIKTTTFALLGLLAWARYRGDEIAHFAGRSLRRDTLELAVGLSVVSFTVVTVGILALTVTEAGNPEAGGFLGRMFEAVSGFNTVGLSTGVTPRLSVAGRLVVVVLMFLGRVGPLSFAAALAVRRPQPGRFRYAYEDVMVG
jgi:trk system potassium uptake protein TrkH